MWAVKRRFMAAAAPGSQQNCHEAHIQDCACLRHLGWGVQAAGAGAGKLQKLL